MQLNPSLWQDKLLPDFKCHITEYYIDTDGLKITYEDGTFEVIDREDFLKQFREIKA